MGCCQSKETLPNRSQNLTRTLSLSKQYTQVNQSGLNKRFSAQIDSIKSSESILNQIFTQCTSSSKQMIECLSRLDFPLSEKKFSENDLPEEVACPRCFLRYSDIEVPLMLNCGHSLCKICCEQLFSEHGNIPCVSICMPTLDPPGVLKVNDWVFDKVKSIESGQYCFTHQTPAELFCSNCKVIICEDCTADHEKHKFIDTKSEGLNEEFKVWEKSLALHQKKIGENRESLLKHQKKYKDLEKNLTELCENHCSSLSESKKQVSSAVLTSTDDHIDHIKFCVANLNEAMPTKRLNLYSNVIQEELNRVNELLSNFERLPVSLSLKEQAKIPLKPNAKIVEPDYKPWEGLSKSLEDMKDFEYFLLALTALKLSDPDLR